MKLIIDRFEGNFAVCEKNDKTIINIDRAKIPSEAKEGDIIVLIENKILIDKTLSEERKEYIKKITKDLWEN